ncbi:MAG: 3-dehydroquinate synthase [Planctomycetota bacterium]|jgi:3-dehydroquinate synthase
MHTVHVKLPGHTYQVMIEPGLLARLGEIVHAVAPHERPLLAVDERIAATHGEMARQSLVDAGCTVAVHALVASESEKTLPAVHALYDAMLAARLERRSPVVAVGGGVIGDTAGFAAATFLRGVPLVQVPTTLLAMIDAAIGGKTGVNHRLPSGELGKNLVGAFWQPRAVLVDPDVLHTLEDRDLHCGLAECVKHGLLADVDLLTFLAENVEAIGSREADVLVELIRRAAKVKVAIVQQDEREAGVRALLNLGHTFAHAVEPIAALDLRHGEAVALGLCAAARCSVLTDRMTSEEAQQVVDLLAMLCLPTCLPVPMGTDALIEAMGYDKKVADGRLRLVLPTGIGGASIVSDVPRDVIEQAWLAIGAEPGTGS